MSNFVSCGNVIILLGINCRLILTFFLKLTFNFNLRYFSFSVNYLALTELKTCLKILSGLTLNEVNVSHELANAANNIMFSNIYCICLFKMDTRPGCRIVSRLCE